jgi:hypothetical protein
VTINPVVAPIGAHAGDPWAGVWLAEDVEALHQGMVNGSWIEASLCGVGAGLDALAAISDPAGALLQYGLSWLMEHIRPLSQALDWLAGDPAQIGAHAAVWRGVSARLQTDAADLVRGAASDVAGWSGAAASAYAGWVWRQRTVLGALARASETMASVSEAAAYLTAGVRIMVRDAIAIVVSRAIDYAAEEVFSFGLATPWVIEQVSSLVAAWSTRIGRWLTALRDSLGRLSSLMNRLGEIMDQLKALLRDDRGSIGGDPRRPPTVGSDEPARSAGHWSSPDPLVGDLADKIEAAKPGAVRGVNIKAYRPDGTLATDFDIETATAVVQVKPGTGRGALRQATETASVTTKTVIVYGPSLGWQQVRNLENAGFKVATSQDQLISMIEG